MKLAPIGPSGKLESLGKLKLPKMRIPRLKLVGHNK